MANSNVQTQALEVLHSSCSSHAVSLTLCQLIRTKRLFSHTAMHAASKNFLFISLQAVESHAKLGFHLVGALFYSIDVHLLTSI